MKKDFEFYQGKIHLSNGPGCYKITEDPLWLLSVLPLDQKSYLEVGCATGVLSLILKLKNPNANITAIDIQECMINQAKQHAENNKINGISFIQEDLFNLSTDKKYDCVFSNPPFFNDYCCDIINDKVKGIAHLQTDIISFINKQLEHVNSNGILCFMGHISIRKDLILELKNKVHLTEISLISKQKKEAKRFIYIINKNKIPAFNKFKLNSFDNNIRNDILFLYQKLNQNLLTKIN